MRKPRCDKGVPKGWKCDHPRTEANTYRVVRKDRNGAVQERCKLCLAKRAKVYAARRWRNLTKEQRKEIYIKNQLRLARREFEDATKRTETSG